MNIIMVEGDTWVRVTIKYEACYELCSILQESYNIFDLKVEEIMKFDICIFLLLYREEG